MQKIYDIMCDIHYSLRKYYEKTRIKPFNEDLEEQILRVYKRWFYLTPDTSSQVKHSGEVQLVA